MSIVGRDGHEGVQVGFVGNIVWLLNGSSEAVLSKFSESEIDIHSQKTGSNVCKKHTHTEG